MKSIQQDRPAIVTVPCFSGAPWELDQLTPLSDWPLRTMQLPEGVDDIETYADFVEEQVSDLDDYILVGDSFGAVVSLGVAVRRPNGLKALVLSGGFAANPVTNPFTKFKLGMACFMPGFLYRQLVLRFHAQSLASPYDAEGEIPWSKRKSRELFLEYTPHRSYVARTKAAFAADFRDRLGRIEVPTLILTPDHDVLIGEEAADVMLDGIPNAKEVVLPRTGHMFRFSHPVTYSREIRSFLEKVASPRPVRRQRSTRVSTFGG